MLSLPLFLARSPLGYVFCAQAGRSAHLSAAIAGSGVIFLRRRRHAVVQRRARGAGLRRCGDIRDSEFFRLTQPSSDSGANPKARPTQPVTTIHEHSTLTPLHRSPSSCPSAGAARSCASCIRNTGPASQPSALPYEFIFVIDGPQPDAAHALEELLTTRASRSYRSSA